MSIFFNLSGMAGFFLLLVLVALQWYLSNRENRYLGLLLPLGTFLYSLYHLILVEKIHPLGYADGFLAFVTIVLVSNVLTYVLLGLHLGVRGLKGW